MLTKEEVIEIRFICYALDCNTEEEIAYVVNRYIKAKIKRKVNVNKVIADIVKELDKDN